MLPLTSFDIKWKERLDSNSNLNQVPFPKIHYYYEMKHYRLHITGYSEN
jgi:hypothetical protein